MPFGIFTGTFSSIYVAGAVLLWIEHKWPRPRGVEGQGHRARRSPRTVAVASGERRRRPLNVRRNRTSTCTRTAASRGGSCFPMTAFIDSHAHLADPAFDADRDAVIERARAAGAAAIVCIGESLAAAAPRADDRRSASGLRLLHRRRSSARRRDVRSPRATSPRFETLVRARRRRDRRVRTRLPLRPLAARARSVARSRAQLALARELDRPVVVHTRDAEDDTRAMVRRGRRARACVGVLHCYTGLASPRRGRARRPAGTSRSAASSRSRSGRTTRCSASCPTIGCSSNRTRRISRPCRTAASETSRRGSASPSRDVAAARGVDADALGAHVAETRDGCSGSAAATASPRLELPRSGYHQRELRAPRSGRRTTREPEDRAHRTTRPPPSGRTRRAIVANGFLFTAGQIALDPATGQIVAGDVVAQTERVHARISPAVLDAAGATWSDVVKTTVFLHDMNDFPRVNEVYARALGDARPARSTVQVSGAAARRARRDRRRRRDSARSYE